MAEHEAETVVKTAITRAWNDFEPKFVAWVTAGGLLTAATLVYYYLDPKSTLPVWVAPVITYLGGLIVSYLKRSAVKSPVVAPVADGVADVTSLPVGVPTTDSTTPEVYAPDAVVDNS